MFDRYLEEKVSNLIDDLPNSQCTSSQLYGLAYILILDSDLFFRDRHRIVDQLIKSIKKVTLSEGNFIFLSVEGDNLNNYYISHYYNTVLNTLIYVSLKYFIKKDKYRNLEVHSVIKKLEESIPHEISLLKKDYKTIGAELVIGKYIGNVSNIDRRIKFKFSKERKERIKKFSKILAYTPEGLPEFINNTFVKRSVYKFLENNNLTDCYLYNSPELTYRFADTIKDMFPKRMTDLLLTLNSHEGTPPFFKGIFFDLFWIVDILHSANLLSNDLVNTSVKLFTKINDVKNEVGTFDEKKGFSISPGFPMYDLDTTAMGMKFFHYVQIRSTDLSDYAYTYYQNNQTQLYSTYKRDNRISISAILHALNAQAYVDKSKVNTKALDYAQEAFRLGEYKDKYNKSDLYVLYCYTKSFVDLNRVGLVEDLILDEIVKKILSHKKQNGLLSSICPDGTFEESAWGILALKYYLEYKKNRNIESKYNELIEVTKTFSKKVTNVVQLERIWTVKQIYVPINIVKTLLYVINAL